MSVQIYQNSAWKRVADLPGQHSTKVVNSANYVVSDNDGYDSILVTTGASDRTITLPTAADNTFRVLKIIKVDPGTGKLIVDGEGSETINGASILQLIFQYSFVDLLCTGSGWIVVSTSNSLSDLDGDTHLKVEATADADQIVCTVAGNVAQRIYSDGTIDFPKQSGVTARLSANHDAPVNPTVVPYDTVAIGDDEQGEFNTSTNRFTVERDGWYLVSHTVKLAEAMSGDHSNVHIYVNGVPVAGTLLPNLSGYTNGHCVTIRIHCDANDYIQGVFSQSYTENRLINKDECALSIQRLM